MRRMAVEYIEQYRSGGNAALAVYHDADSPISISGEFEDMVRRSPGLATIPEVRPTCCSTREPGLRASRTSSTGHSRSSA